MKQQLDITFYKGLLLQHSQNKTAFSLMADLKNMHIIYFSFVHNKIRINFCPPHPTQENFEMTPVL